MKQRSCPSFTPRARVEMFLFLAQTIALPDVPITHWRAPTPAGRPSKSPSLALSSVISSILSVPMRTTPRAEHQAISRPLRDP
jgi:hypothetical protein